MAKKPIDLNSYPNKCRTVMIALESLGLEPGWELVHGEGYFYFVSPKNHPMLEASGVYTYRLGDLTLGRWIEEFKYITGRGDDMKPLPVKPEHKDPINITTSAGNTTISLKPKS